jgi:regulator of protease activity HflC (stomatin/prohibitin superfamily)
LIPLGIDRPITDNVVVRATDTRTITLTLKDGATIAVGAVVRYYIKDIKKALLEVEGLDDFLKDAIFSTLSRQAMAETWESIQSEEFLQTLTTTCRKMGRRYGVEVENVAFSDLARVRALRLMNT